jgi:adenosylcobinamide-phosphate synthase
VFLSHMSLWSLCLALLLDGLFSEPSAVWARLPHPVVLMGQGIAALDRCWNSSTRSAAQNKAMGALALAILVVSSLATGFLIEALFRRIPYGFFGIALVASTLLAQRSLYAHILAVRKAFAEGGIEAARTAVARVVGRDVASLDAPAICRAAIESCAENFSDGVVAPAFWFALFGLPGLLVYKIVNTADSMIGHKTERHAAFGWAAARFDDLLNLVPARLAGLLLSLTAPIVGGSMRQAAAIMIRDARLHRSPNAGWPESAAAGALGLALNGPRQYQGEIADDPFLNRQGRRIAVPEDITRALRLLLAACGLEFAVYATLAWCV